MKLVRVQEVAIDWQGASFSDNDKQASQGFISGLVIILSRWITDTMSAAMQGRSICELGAGAGLPGIAAAAYCGAESVLLTDLFETTVDNLNRNIEMNKNVLTASVTAKAVDWNDANTWPSQKFGVVLGSDLVYCQEMVPSLITMVAAMLAEDGVFLYVARSRMGSSILSRRCRTLASCSGPARWLPSLPRKPTVRGYPDKV